MRRSRFWLLFAVAAAATTPDEAESCDAAEKLAAWAHPSLQLPGVARAETSDHPLLLGASPGTTGTMSVYFALKRLGVSAVHYTRQFNATSGVETTTYADTPPGGPVPLLKPLFGDTHPAPPVDLQAARAADLRFLAATDALLDTPSMELFFDLLATFPRARVLLTARAPGEWAASRRARHPTDRVPVLPQLGFDVPMGAIKAEQSAAAVAMWHKAVVGSVAPERLLVLDVFTTPPDELWRQLCAFVGKPLPREPGGELPPFPHLEYAADMRSDAPT